MASLLNNFLLISSLLLLTSVIVSKSSSRFGLPILIVFLFIGMFAGSEGFGGIQYENYELTHSLSLVAICLIIFSGGLLTKTSDIKPILKSGVSLASLGVLLTTFIVGGFSYLILKTPIYESLLIGAILSSTDAAAVFTAFRDKNAQVSRNVKSVLEFESGSNDPMAYLLVTIFLGLYQNKISFDLMSMKMIILNPLIGLVGGYLFFKIFKYVNDIVVLDFQGLYPALTLGFLFLSYSGVEALGGNGFLSVYLFGLQIGNTKILHKNTLVTFFDGVSWLFQIGLFILLGLLVFPSRLINIAPQGLLVGFFLIIVARPIVTFISLAFSSFTKGEKLFISWSGLKGATPIVFASFAATNLGSEANFIFDIVFFSVLLSALIQGSTIKIAAKKLNLLYESIYDPEFPVDLEVLEKTKNGIKEIQIQSTDYANERRVVDLNLSKGTIVLFIKRSGAFIIPDGSTIFKAGDKVLVVTSEKNEITSAVEHFSIEHKQIIDPENSAI